MFRYLRRSRGRKKAIRISEHLAILLLALLTFTAVPLEVHAGCRFNAAGDYICPGGGGSPKQSGASIPSAQSALPSRGAPAAPIANNPNAGLSLQARIRELQQQQEQLEAERAASEAQLREDAARADAAWRPGGGGTVPTDLCSTEGLQRQIFVGNSAELRQALASAQCGDEIILRNGSYNGDFQLNNRCAAGSPIAIRAENLQGATFNGVFTLSGSNTTLYGMEFRNGQVVVTGSNNQVLANHFNGGNRRAIVIIGGAENNLIAYNEINDLRQTYGIQVRVSGNGPNPFNNTIYRNHIHDDVGPRRNGAEAIQVGQGPRTTHYNAQTLILENRIERWSVDGEVIGLKTSGNTVRGNTFLDSQGYVSFRHGRNNVLDGNYVSGLSGGVRIHGDNHTISNNTVNGMTLPPKVGPY